MQVKGSWGALCLGRITGFGTGLGEVPGVSHSRAVLRVQLELVWARGLGLSRTAVAGWPKHLDPAPTHIIRVKGECKKTMLIGISKPR